MTCNSCIHFGICQLENETPARCQHFMPNIVRCSECAFFRTENGICLHPHNRAFNTGIVTFPNWFCSGGAKK